MSQMPAHGSGYNWAFQEAAVRRPTAIILGCVVAFAVVPHAQDRPRNPVRVPNGGPAPGSVSPGSVAPRGAPGTVTIYPQIMHLRFTKAVTAPATQGETQDVRAHLESPVLGTAGGSTQKVVVIPSDIDVNLDVTISQADPQRTNARLIMRVMSANVDPAEGRRRFFSADVFHNFVGWPKPGDVLIPAGATLSIPHFGGTGPAEVTASDPNMNRAEDSYPSHPILMSVRLPIALVDQAIDVTNAGSNKLFRAQLTADMEYMSSQTPLPAGAIKLTKGTEVYVRSYEQDPSAPLGHIASWSVDFVVVNGKRIPVRGVEVRQPFTPGSVAIAPNGRGRIPVVLWPVGQNRYFLIAENQEVSTNGTALWTYPTTTDVAPTSAASVSTPSTSSAAPSVAAPPTAGPATPTDAQQRIEETRKRAQERAACQQQAIKDHPADPAGLAQALAACNPQQRK